MDINSLKLAIPDIQRYVQNDLKAFVRNEYKIVNFDTLQYLKWQNDNRLNYAKSFLYGYVHIEPLFLQKLNDIAVTLGLSPIYTPYTLDAMLLYNTTDATGNYNNASILKSQNVNWYDAQNNNSKNDVLTLPILFNQLRVLTNPSVGTFENYFDNFDSTSSGQTSFDFAQWLTNYINAVKIAGLLKYDKFNVTKGIQVLAIEFTFS